MDLQAIAEENSKQRAWLTRPLFWCGVVCGCLAATVGCNRNPYLLPPGGRNPNGPYPAGAPAAGGYQAGVTPAAPGAGGPQSVYAQQQTSPQLVELRRRVEQLDANNRQLTTQLAQAQQQAQAAQERSDLLAKQLQDTASQLRMAQRSQQQLSDQARGLQASIRARGGARLTANNSVAASASGLQIAGAQVFTEGDLVRIRVPADQLFVSGTARLNNAAYPVLDQIADALIRQFGRQRVAIEGHTDSMPGGGGSTPYKVASDQAQAVLDSLVARNGVPSQQLFVVAHGANHPLADNQSAAGRAQNRRIEVVVYPETY